MTFFDRPLKYYTYKIYAVKADPLSFFVLIKKKSMLYFFFGKESIPSIFNFYSHVTKGAIKVA